MLWTNKILRFESNNQFCVDFLYCNVPCLLKCEDQAHYKATERGPACMSDKLPRWLLSCSVSLKMSFHHNILIFWRWTIKGFVGVCITFERHHFTKWFARSLMYNNTSRISHESFGLHHTCTCTYPIFVKVTSGTTIICVTVKVTLDISRIPI